jgi:hypothetical protein
MLTGAGRRIPMGKVVEKRALYASLALALLLAPYSGGQQVEAAALPAQIITGKKYSFPLAELTAQRWLLSNVPATAMNLTTGSPQP